MVDKLQVFVLSRVIAVVRIDEGVTMLQIAKLSKENSSKPRTVVITQGADATIVAKDGKASLLHWQSYQVDKAMWATHWSL